MHLTCIKNFNTFSNNSNLLSLLLLSFLVDHDYQKEGERGGSIRFDYDSISKLILQLKKERFDKN